MARTNIEEEAHRRVAKLAGLLNCSDREALGTVGYLWTDSQDILATEGTEEQILEWAHLFHLSKQDRELWISSLEKSRFISRLENGHFKIHGNETQIDQRVKFTSRAAKGGNALKKKWNAKKRLKAGLKQATSTPQEPKEPANSSPMQCNSMQDNAKQSNSKQSNAKALMVTDSPAKPSIPDEGISLNRRIWESYSNAYFDRYGTEPVRDQVVNAQIQKFGKRLGEDAPEVAAFYVRHDKAFYVTNLHKVGLMLTDAEPLRTQWATNRVVTNREAIQADDSNALAQQLKRLREKGL